MTTWLPHPIYTAVLAVVWMVLQSHFTVGEFLIGYVLGAVIVYVHRDHWIGRAKIVRAGTMLRLAVTFVREVVKANVQVAGIVLRPRLRIRPAFITIPLDLEDDLLIYALANMITLTPGTLSVDVAADRSALYVHCLSTDDVDAVRRQIKAQFEGPLGRGVRCLPQ